MGLENETMKQTSREIVMDSTKLVRIQVYADPIQAELDAALLRSSEIDCSVTGGHVGNALSWFGLAVAKVELWTRADDAEAACQLLQQPSPRKSGPAESQWQTTEDLDWVCPHCDERNAWSFDECWACGKLKPENPERRASQEEPAYTVTEDLVESHAADDPSPYRPPMVTSSTLQLSNQHDLVRRAQRSAILALFFPPLAFYSLYLAWQCFQTGEPPAGVYVAIVLALVMAPLSFLFSFGVFL